VIAVSPNPPYSVIWSTTTVADGAYDLRFEVTDEATPPNVSTEDLASKIVDNTPPTASMGSPLNGAVVSGGVTLGVSANDDNPIKQVEYFVRGSSAGVVTSAPFQGSWNSAASGDGPAQIYAVVEDMAGNSTTTNTITVTADNFAPAVSMSSPGPAIRGTVSLSASADGDTSQVTFERRPAGGGGWTTIGTANGAPWSTSFDTSTVADGDYELRAIATDAGGNSGTSSAVTTKVDNTNPSGALTTPGNGQQVGGPAVALEANASDGGSGVSSVTFQYRQSGVGGWTDAGSDSSAPFQATWDTTSLASLAHDLQAIVTDAAGNQFTTGIVTVVVDSTAPGVTLDDPGAQISGTVALSASTTGDATVVAFAYSPAGASSWTAIGSDGSAPYGANFNTTTTADGMYDLRAVVSDAVGNTSSSIRPGVRIDNFMPVLTSSNPANGSIVASASSVVLDFSEAAAASNLVLDANPAPCAPPCSGSSVTLNTGPLANGSHTVTGNVTDSAGNSSSFSVSFVVGVPATPPPDPASGSGGTPFGLPLVPTPTDFRGRIEADGTLTLQWTPAKAGSTQLATILLVDGIATQSFAPGADETNLGAFDPADMRTFSVAAVGTDGRVGPDTWKLRSTSLLAGKPLAEVEASLVNRGLRLGAVSGSGSVVVEPHTALLVPLDHPVDVTLGEPAAPQTKLVFQVVGAKTFSRKVRKYVALRIKVTRAAQVTATLLSPGGARVYRWRFSAKAGAGIVRLTMPPQVRKAGRYRLVFTVQSGRDVVKRTIALRIMGPQDRDITPARAPVDVVLAGNAGIRKELALGLQDQGVRVTAASGDDDAFGLAGSSQRNVRVMVVDADRYGVGLVRDLATVFPGMRIIALTNDPRRLAQAIRAGATIAVPRSTPSKELAKLIARLARR
jgi:Bacterial Ig domain/Bacterial Ig-like domain